MFTLLGVALLTIAGFSGHEMSKAKDDLPAILFMALTLITAIGGIAAVVYGFTPIIEHLR